MTDLETVERFIAAELEDRRAGGEDCPECGYGYHPGKRLDFASFPCVLLVDAPCG